MSNDTLGKYIRDKRELSEKSLRKAAKDAGIVHSYLIDIENDTRIPTPTILRDIAKSIGASYRIMMTLAGYIDEQLTESKLIEEALGVKASVWEEFSEKDRKYLLNKIKDDIYQYLTMKREMQMEKELEEAASNEDWY